MTFVMKIYRLYDFGKICWYCIDIHTYICTMYFYIQMYVYSFMSPKMILEKQYMYVSSDIMIIHTTKIKGSHLAWIYKFSLQQKIIKLFNVYLLEYKFYLDNPKIHQNIFWSQTNIHCSAKRLKHLKDIKRVLLDNQILQSTRFFF